MNGPARTTATALLTAAGYLYGGSFRDHASASALAEAPQREHVRRQPDAIVTLVISAMVPWTDTGVEVAKGDGVEVKAWGRVIYDAAVSASASPAGSGRRGGGCSFVVTDGKVAAHSVVGNVAPSLSLDGRGFFVGSAWKGTVPIAGSTAPEGRLFLGFNDDGVLCDRSGYDSWEFGVNNAGWFTAEVAVVRVRNGRP